MKKFLDGKKSYIGFIALGVCAVANALGIIEGDVAKGAFAVIATFTGVSMRQAIAKTKAAVETVEKTIEV